MICIALNCIVAVVAAVVVAGADAASAVTAIAGK